MDTEFIQDDMLFKPYKTMGGWQCIIKIKTGRISVRLGGHGLITSAKRPYEVWYPTEDTPMSEQTADDIYNYIRNNG